jgi:MFS family permease
MTSVLAVGAITVGVALSGRGTVAGLSTYMVASIAAMAVSLIALAFAGSFVIALVCMFALGFTFMGMRAATLTLVQYNVDPSKRGRVAAIYGLVGHSAPAIGALAVGALGDRFGIPLMVGLVGVITAGIAGLALYYRAACAASLEGPAAAAEPTLKRAAE